MSPGSGDSSHSFSIHVPGAYPSDSQESNDEVHRNVYEALPVDDDVEKDSDNGDYGHADFVIGDTGQ
ncbi:Fc.00g092440.m01.CDS01 [Cosmosporella sp. VM-42]